MLQARLSARRATRCWANIHKRRKQSTETSYSSTHVLAEDIVNVLPPNDHHPNRVSGWINPPEDITRENLLAKAAAGSTKGLPLGQMDFLVETDDETVASNGKVLVPGTFVELRRNFLFVHGVVLGEWLSETSTWMVHTLTTTGEVYQHKRDDVMFEVPALVSLDLATRCGRESSTNPSELNARIAVVKRMRDFQRAFKAEQLMIGKSFSSFHRRVAPRDPKEWGSISLHQAAKLLAPARSTKVTTLLAIQNLMFEDCVHFIADTQNYVNTRTFHIRPQVHVDDIAKVTDMCRKRTHLEAFVTRAKPVILNNRRRHHATRSEPMSQRPMDSSYTAEDRVFIRFLMNALQPRRTVQGDPFTMASTIIKSFGYEGDITDALIHQAVVELGAISPWQDLTSLRRDLNLDPGPVENTPGFERDRQLSAQVALNAPSLPTKPTGTLLGPEDFVPQDELHHIRHDFGNLPVFVIDDVSAHELDDAVSLERIPNDPSKVWVHVHIADPATVLHPSHVFATRARRQSQSIYMPHRTWPMLPHDLIYNRLSLGTLASAGMPETVLTFSAKVDVDTGKRSDIKIRAGIIRNVQKIDYDSVDHALGRDSTDRTRYLFGSTAPNHQPTPITPEHKADLADLVNIAERVAKAAKTSAYSSYPSRVQPSVSPRPIYGGLVNLEHEATEFSGYPQIKYLIDAGQQDIRSSSRDAIATFAVMTGHIASIWAVEHGVPVIRRALAPPLLTDDLREAWRKYTEVNLDGSPKKWVDFVKSGVTLPTAVFTAEPREHFSLGIPSNEGYSQVTSPLRRYVDLVNHWQIRHTLLRAPGSTSGFPFSPEWMAKFAMEANVRNIIRVQSQRAAISFWSMAKLASLWQPNIPLGELPAPLSHLNALITNTYDTVNVIYGTYHRTVHIEELGTSATIVFEDDSMSAQLKRGDSVPVRIKEIRMGNKPTLFVELR